MLLVVCANSEVSLTTSVPYNWVVNFSLLKWFILFSQFIGGTGIILMAFSHNLWTMLVTTTLFSIGNAGYFAIINPILIDQFGRNNSSSSWGFVRTWQGVLNCVYPTMLGKVRILCYPVSVRNFTIYLTLLGIVFLYAPISVGIRTYFSMVLTSLGILFSWQDLLQIHQEDSPTLSL